MILLLCMYSQTDCAFGDETARRVYLDRLGLCGLEGGCVWWFGSGRLRRGWGGTERRSEGDVCVCRSCVGISALFSMFTIPQFLHMVDVYHTIYH